MIRKYPVTFQPNEQQQLIRLFNSDFLIDLKAVQLVKI